MNLFSAAVVLAAVGCGLMAGLFFAFSVSVMRALSGRPASDGMATMQSINRTILNPVFLGCFLATAAACLVVTLATLTGANTAGAVHIASGAILYLVGGLGVTAVCNVPRNNSLDRLDPADPESEGHWRRYLSEWTMWNHVRTGASLLAAALLSTGLAA